MKNSIAFAILVVLMLGMVFGCDEVVVENYSIVLPETESAASAPPSSRGVVKVQVFYVEARDSPNAEKEWRKYSRQIRRQVDDVRILFRSEMERHGHRPKTFGVRRTAQGAVDVKRIKLGLPQYPDTNSVAGELGLSVVGNKTDIRLYFINIQIPNNEKGGTAAGKSAYIWDFENSVIAHELGHVFGLSHDFRDRRFIMSYGNHIRYGSGPRVQEEMSVLSKGAANWLNVQHDFNGRQHGLKRSANRLFSIDINRVERGWEANFITVRLPANHHQSQFSFDSELMHPVILGHLEKPDLKGIYPIVLDYIEAQNLQVTPSQRRVNWFGAGVGHITDYTLRFRLVDIPMDVSLMSISFMTADGERLNTQPDFIYR